MSIDSRRFRKARHRPFCKEFGTTGSGRFPRVRISIQGDGHLHVTICRTHQEYVSAGSDGCVFFGLSIAGARKLVDALRSAVPEARREQKARSYRRRKNGF